MPTVGIRAPGARSKETDCLASSEMTGKRIGIVHPRSAAKSKDGNSPSVSDKKHYVRMRTMILPYSSRSLPLKHSSIPAAAPMAACRISYGSLRTAY